MAGFEMDFPEDFLSELFQTDADDICKEALLEAAPILENNMKDILRQDNHELSGELIESIKATKPTKAKNGAWMVHVRPTGYSSINSFSVKGKGEKMRKYKISNSLKMIWIEYGVAGRQPARPFLQRLVNQTRSASMAKMQEVYNRKTGARDGF